MQLEIKKTDDGSTTVRIPDIDECYHSRRGAWNESKHVYIDAGFRAWLIDHPEASGIRIFEMGFGTGLNAAMTIESMDEFPDILVRYDAIELHPLDESIVQQLEFPELRSPERLIDLQRAKFGVVVPVSGHFMLRKFHTSLEAFNPHGVYDVIYFDAFGPRVQPELWRESVFVKLKSMLAPGGRIVTYCAKGYVKRAMRAAGLHVEALPGPPGKREMIRCR